MPANEKKDFFSVLSAIDCGKLVQKRNSLDYLPWATTWKLLKQHYPYSYYRVIKNFEGLNYHHDSRTAWVEVELNLLEPKENGEMQVHSITEMLAVMDYSKRSIPLDKLNSTDVVNTIQRCLTKACARMGLGLAVYGALDFDDLPEEKQPDNVVDLAEIRKQLDTAIREQTREMTRPQKVAFVNDIIAPILHGERHWTVCETLDLLQDLLEAVQGMSA